MTLGEFLAWGAYRKRRGPLNPMLRNESALAVIAAQVNRACGGKADVEDFAPWLKDEADGGVDDVAYLLKGVSASGKP